MASQSVSEARDVDEAHDVEAEPATPATAHQSRLLLRGLVVALILGIGVGAAAPQPLVSIARPTLERFSTPIADRWTPPGPHASVAFSTLPHEPGWGAEGTWILTSDALPVRMHLERDVVEQFGMEALAEALAVWNGIPGSRFAVAIEDVVDEGVRQRRRDGVNRVFLDMVSCGDRFLARAHLYPLVLDIRDEAVTAFVSEVDIGLCPRLTAEMLPTVMAHEVAHLAGVGHLCEPTDLCWRPGMEDDQRCRLLAPRRDRCQERHPADDLAFVYLHPRAPRVGGSDASATSAAASYYAFPEDRAAPTVVIGHEGDDRNVLGAAASLAGAASVPYLLVDEDCTFGPDGEELNRVVSLAATAILAGSVPHACAVQLEVGWQLELDRLADVRAIAERIVELREPDRIVVAGSTDSEGTSVHLATAAALAGALGAPLLALGPDGDVAPVEAFLREHRGIRRVVMVGTSATDQVWWRLPDRIVVTQSVGEDDPVATAIAAAGLLDPFGQDPSVLVAPIDDPVTAAVAAALGGIQRRPVLPTQGDVLHPEVASFVRHAAGGALLVGGEEHLDFDVQHELSRALDRDRG